MKKSLLSMLLVSLCSFTYAQNKTSVSAEKSIQKNEKSSSSEKSLNPASHDFQSGLHYGQSDFGRSSYAEPENNRTVGGREVEAEKAKKEAQQNTPALIEPARVVAQPSLNVAVHVPTYERQTTFNSYLYGHIQNIAITHTSVKLLTSSLDYPAGDLMIDVGKQSEDNVRAYAFVVRLNDGSLTSVFQADRGEGFKMGDRVRAPIILNQNSFIIGLFKKY